MAYFVEVGIVLAVAPWTLFWERNYFLAWTPFRTIVLSPWLRGAVSAMGVVTFIAGLIDLLSVMVRSRPSESESAGTAG